MCAYCATHWQHAPLAWHRCLVLWWTPTFCRRFQLTDVLVSHCTVKRPRPSRTARERAQCAQVRGIGSEASSPRGKGVEGGDLERVGQCGDHVFHQLHPLLLSRDPCGRRFDPVILGRGHGIDGRRCVASRGQCCGTSARRRCRERGLLPTLMLPIEGGQHPLCLHASQPPANRGHRHPISQNPAVSETPRTRSWRGGGIPGRRPGR